MDSSPLTGRTLEQAPSTDGDVIYYNEEWLGRWAVTDTFLQDSGFRIAGSLETEQMKLTEKQTRAVLAVAVSKVWEAEVRKTLPPLFTDESTRQTARKLGFIQGDKFQRRWRIITVEDLWAEASTLTLESKAIRTLVNLRDLEETVGNGVPLRYDFLPFPGSFCGTPSADAYSFPGPFYACEESEASIVLQFLSDMNYIRAGDPSDAITPLYITPSGYAIADSFVKGDPSLARSAFLVCRFTPEMDSIYEKIYKAAGAHPAIKCPVHRVKDVHHVDRIDDRILQEIRAATIVIVDLTDDNFNIAFEAGYALALGKPVVWAKKQPHKIEPSKEHASKGFRLPFDIQSQNILLWEEGEDAKFLELLRYRMLAALERAGVRTDMRPLNT